MEANYALIEKRRALRTPLTIVEPTTCDFTDCFGIGFGIAVHPVFFLAALLIAIAALIQSVLNAAGHLRIDIREATG